MHHEKYTVIVLLLLIIHFLTCKYVIPMLECNYKESKEMRSLKEYADSILENPFSSGIVIGFSYFLSNYLTCMYYDDVIERLTVKNSDSLVENQLMNMLNNRRINV